MYKCENHYRIGVRVSTRKVVSIEPYYAILRNKLGLNDIYEIYTIFREFGAMQINAGLFSFQQYVFENSDNAQKFIDYLESVFVLNKLGENS